jgi:hypothetical protein
MRKFLFATIIVACAASYGWAQSNDDYHKVEFAGGYSLGWLDDGSSDRERFNGLFAEGTGNLTRYVGITGDYSWHRKDFGGVTANLHSLMGGVQVKDNSKETTVKPFAHLMAGFANGRASGFGLSDSSTGFAGMFGGGVDIRAGKRIDIRAIQADYVPTHLDGEWQHNFRIGVGIVVH